MANAAKSILVTGGGGFIGSALVKRLVADGHQVRVLDDFSRGKLRRLDFVQCEVMHGDIRDPAAVLRAVHGCETVIHLASAQGTQVFHEEPRKVLDIGVRGITNILAACEQAGCGELMVMSSSEAYQVAPMVPTPEDIPLVVPDVMNARYSYGGAKIISELMALAWARAGVLDRVIIARPHNIYGDDAGYEHVIPQFGVRMAALAREHPDGPVPFPIQGSGAETRAFCHVSDCTDALALLLEKAGPLGVYHLGTPEEVTMDRLVGLIGKHYGRDVKVISGTLPKGSPPRRCPDISKLRALGYEPKVSLEQGIGPVLDWYRDNPECRT